MKLLTLTLMTLFFFTGCEIDPTDADAVDTPEEGEEETVVQEEVPPQPELSSTSFSCTNDDSTTNINYEVRIAPNSCDPSIHTCCEFYITEDGGSPVLISRQGLNPIRCGVFNRVLGGNSLPGYVTNLADEYQDKANAHVGMTCTQQ